ncbi:MAG: hypothetical protein H6731_04080 [Myxococcales bacterium]|nr:MAG: hypothetical protein H6731_04080 [Myxococcales bacterium]
MLPKIFLVSTIVFHTLVFSTADYQRIESADSCKEITLKSIMQKVDHPDSGWSAQKKNDIDFQIENKLDTIKAEIADLLLPYLRDKACASLSQKYHVKSSHGYDYEFYKWQVPLKKLEEEKAAIDLETQYIIFQVAEKLATELQQIAGQKNINFSFEASPYLVEPTIKAPSTGCFLTMVQSALIPFCCGMFCLPELMCEYGSKDFFVSENSVLCVPWCFRPRRLQMDHTGLSIGHLELKINYQELGSVQRSEIEKQLQRWSKK